VRFSPIVLRSSTTYLDVLCCGGVEDLVDARPVAGPHAHGARLAAGVQHAAAQVRRAQALAGITDRTDLAVPAQQSLQQEKTAAEWRTACNNKREALLCAGALLPLWLQVTLAGHCAVCCPGTPCSCRVLVGVA
jgi:hypothetical protein